MTTYVLGQQAAEDIRDIWSFISARNVEVADRLVASFADAFENLAKMPRLGHVRPDLTSASVLFWPIDPYLVIYRVQGARVQIVAVTHGARDVPELLRRRL